MRIVLLLLMFGFFVFVVVICIVFNMITGKLPSLLHFDRTLASFSAPLSLTPVLSLAHRLCIRKAGIQTEYKMNVAIGILRTKAKWH